MNELVSGRRLVAERFLFDLRLADTAALVRWQQPLSILDLGSGRMRPQLQLLSRAGHNVTGVDLTNNDRLSAKAIAYSVARAVFSSQAARAIPAESRPGTVRLISCNVESMPFPDESFDLVTSVAAFEHFLNPEKVIEEIRRVLRPGGVAWLWIHSFTALSGAHNVGNTFPPVNVLPEGVAPWDHLRGKREPVTVPLNCWRPGQYVETVQQTFRVHRHYFPISEGEEYLTPQIEAELSTFSREELLGAALVIVAQKAS